MSVVLRQWTNEELSFAVAVEESLEHSVEFPPVAAEVAAGIAVDGIAAAAAVVVDVRLAAGEDCIAAAEREAAVAAQLAIVED